MKNKNHRLIIYFIAITIVATIAIQVYWNIKNYEANKQQLINEVQIAFDNGVEIYYTDLAKTNVITFTTEAVNGKTSYFLKNVSKSITLKTDSLDIMIRDTSIKKGVNPIFNKALSLSDSLKKCCSNASKKDTFWVNKKFSVDSIINVQGISGVSVVKDTSQGLNKIRELTNKIIISLVNDSIEFSKLSPILNEEFERKGIAMNFALAHYSKNDSLIGSFNDINDQKYKLFTFSKPTYLPRQEQLKILFPNLSFLTLKKGLTGILLSFLLSVSIIACLLYLLKIINKQKELAEIKNDLISNITHEFKTPIATVSTALEGIERFNANDDKEKTKKYLGISNQQLKKLHSMVEKLLETSTLDSDKLLLNKEAVDIVKILNNLTDKHQMIAPEKYISFKSNIETHIVEVDPFHFENAVSNLIDNAIKYGGDTIEINLNSVLDSSEITIADDGGSIEKGHRDKIFDKFYRIPTGNQHDVKGFGIGLYYTKKIIEKHNGSIQLVPDIKHTIFKIQL
ncbi:hypothetical protein GTQ40_00325 [Flavobacteriaceae bacterium R38]|nr:hypothetical protein [Flavobacteriaceae bacterium R38]